MWRRTADGYDRERVGLEVKEFTEVPAADRGIPNRREYFDTRLTDTGKSAAGHDFAEVLTKEERAGGAGVFEAVVRGSGLGGGVEV